MKGCVKEEIREVFSVMMGAIVSLTRSFAFRRECSDWRCRRRPRRQSSGSVQEVGQFK